MLRKGNAKWVNFVIHPLVFFICTYLLLAIAFGPFITSYYGIAKLLFTKAPPIFEDEPKVIYRMIERAVTGTDAGDTTVSEGDNSDQGSSPIEETQEITVVEHEINVHDITYPTQGVLYGQVYIQSVNIDVPLYFGDGNKQLRDGVGTYSGTYIPGQGRTILIAGHNNTYFYYLDQVEVGDMVEINTNYGLYHYKITEKRIARHDDETAIDLTRQEENLILYTCYNGNAPRGLTPFRCFVYAEYISGPRLVSKPRTTEYTTLS